jgi:hypothetical protein
MKVKITKEQKELLNTGTIVSTTENVIYHYLPFWYKETEDEDVFEIIPLGKLMGIDKLTEQILEITNNSDCGGIDLDSPDANRIRVALTQAMNYSQCCKSDSEQLCCDKCGSEEIEVWDNHSNCKKCLNVW